RKRAVFNRTEELDESLLILLAEGGEATLSELAEQLEVSYSTVQRAVRRLRRAGRLSRSGSRRFGVWDVL
ncbi:MAG: winged helix-turn-helix transcriptional regulator, partial [Oligosphaeraceae bacterium]